MNQINIQRKNRNKVRALYRQNLRRAAVISDYLLVTVPQQHLEAVQFVDNLQRLYPDKKDLRKTHEFLAYQKSKLGISNTPERKRRTTSVIKHRVTTEKKKQMVLNIQLTNKSTITKTSQTVSGPERNEVITEPPTPTKTVPDPGQVNIQPEQANIIFQDIPAGPEPGQVNIQPEQANIIFQDIPAGPEPGQVNIQPEQAISIFQDIPTGPESDQVNSIFQDIPNDVMNRMLKDINDDPCLKAILDQFDFYEEEVVDEGDLFDIDINIDKQSLLEKELSNL